jgi:hypothetical protein
MSGFGDGYVGTAQDAVKIRRLQKQREAEQRKIQELKDKSASGGGNSGLLQFGSSTSEVSYPLDTPILRNNTIRTGANIWSISNLITYSYIKIKNEILV